MIKDKSFLITGAANGIGRQLALGLAGKGARLMLVDRDLDQLQDSFRESEQVRLRYLDVTQEDGWKAILAQTLQAFEQLDYCVNCAGVIRPGFLLDSEPAHIRYHLDVNTKGVMYGTLFAARVMEAQKSGHIINVASLAGIAPIQGISLYSASKFAVRGFSLAAGYELEEHDIHVSVLCPDLVNTGMLTTQLQYPEESAITFSGPAKTLTVEDLEQAFYTIMRKKPREYCVPASRGWLAKIGNTFPGLGGAIARRIRKKGLQRIEKLNQKK